MDFRRTPILAALLFLAAWPLRAQLAPPTDIPDHPPRFQLDATGASSTGTSPYADYNQAPYTSMPVGKTLVLPVVVTGSGALRFSAKSDNPAIVPIIKSGYPFLNIHVVSGDYPVTSGTTTTTTHIDGTLVFALLRDMAPVTAGYISGLAQGGFYDGLQFFRIADLTNATTSGTNGFIAQAGDPSETGTGGPGFSFDNEFHPSLIFTGRGQLAMANAGFNGYAGTNGSQFFLTQGAIRGLDFEHTIFGQLVQGFDVMNKVMAVPVLGGTANTATTGTATKPAVSVIMDSVTVVEDNLHAVLLVSAGGPVGSATISVSATDANGTAATSSVTTGTTTSTITGLNVPISTSSDKTAGVTGAGINDPPIILPVDNVELPLHQGVSLPIRAQDLEFDYLPRTAANLTQSFLTIPVSGNIAIAKPFFSSPFSEDIGLSVDQPLVGGDPVDRTHVRVAFGDGKLTALPLLVTGTAGQTFATTGTLGMFLDSNPRLTGSNFDAAINYADGSPLVSSSDTTFFHPAGGGPTTFAIALSATMEVTTVTTSTSGSTVTTSTSTMVTGTAPHAYPANGIYPLTVTLTDTNGGLLLLRNTAVISDVPIKAQGRRFTAPKGLANTQVADFYDTGGGSKPASFYTASINWGDGSPPASGTIRGTAGHFYVYGRHKYAAGTTYPVDVSIVSGTGFATAWGMATLSGVPTHQPPFAQVHINGELGGVGFASSRSISADVTLLNSGNLKSGRIKLAFFLSNSPSFTASSATPLTVANQPTYETVPIGPGQASHGTVSNIFIPAGVTTNGKYLVMVIEYTDPIQSSMAAPNFAVDPTPLF